MKSFNLFSIILISFLGIIVYSNTFFCSFHFDDELFIVHNSAIKNIHNLHNIWHYFHGRFFTFFSLALNYHFNALNVLGYHLFNLGVHVVSAILVWWLTILTLSTPAMKDPSTDRAGNNITQHTNIISLFAGLVFVTHPVQVEAVTYIWQRAASMAAMFYLASLCFYIKSRLSGRMGDPAGRLYYIFSLITAVVAMFTKENAVTLPLMILFYEFTFLKFKRSLDWKYISPFLVTMFLIPVTFLFIKSQTFQDMHGDLRVPGGGITPIHYILTQCRAMFTYIRLVFLPFNQNIDYDYPIFNNIFDLPVLISLLFLMTILYCAKRLFLKYRLVSFSIFWFFLTLTIPESSFWAMGDLISEHRLYLPLVGYSMFLVSSLYYLLGRHSIKMMMIALLSISAYNSVLTYQRNKAWENELTLWGDAVHKSPHKARPAINLGCAYASQGKFKQAMDDFNKAIEINSNNSDVYVDRGVIYASQGKFKQARDDFNKAIAINPKNEEAYGNRGLAYDQQGNFRQALLDYNKAIEINPNYKEAYENRAIFYTQQGDFIQALSDYNKEINLNSRLADIYDKRGLIYSKLNDFTQAAADFTRGIEIDPQNAEAYNDRGSIYGERNNFSQAIADFTKAIAINPKYAQAYYNRAGTYYLSKEYDDAWNDVHQAEAFGFAPDGGFISALKKVSGRDH